MLISSLNTMLESRHWSEHTWSTDQGVCGRIERFAVCSASSWCCRRCCWDVYWFCGCNHQGDWPLTSIPVCYLTWSSWKPPHMPHSLVSRSYTKLAPFLSPKSIIWLIVFAAFEDSKGIPWSDEKPCKQHPSAVWPARQAQGSSNLSPIVPYN